jgi:hypothetical protein
MSRRVKNAFYHVVGIVFLVLARLKHLLSGYTTPKPFALDQVDKCIDYDVTIANRFLDNLARCGASDLAGKRVLELGPGSDLGIGLILISKGASAYVAFDRHNLAGDVPTEFYEKLARRVPIDLTALSDGRISYIAREDFDLAAAVPTGIDIVLSNAAFEHFDDVEATVKSLSTITNAGAKAAIEIDLQTHSRWIRDADPNNIYRYPEMLYHLFKCPGQPNRLRPDDYRRAFERNGWTDITLYPENLLDERLSNHTVHRAFRNRQLDWLSFVLCATKGDG